MKNSIQKIVIILGAVFVSSSALGYKIFSTGSLKDVQKTTQSITCLAGGGADDYWAEGWRRMLKQANGGDVLIIRSDGKRGGYENWIFNDSSDHKFPTVNSVSTLLLEKLGDGDSPEIENLIRKSEMIFFAGGDQYMYHELVKGTRMEAALNYVLHRKKVPFGGTSAGMMILGDIDYTGRYGSPSQIDGKVTSEDVMKDPMGTFVDFERGFLTAPFMQRVIIDSHFSQRRRQGRLVGFMARATVDKFADINAYNVRGIGVDEGTAVCYSKFGPARVYGIHSAYFLSGNGLIERIVSGSSLDWFVDRSAVKVYAIHGSSKSLRSGFDLSTWSGFGGQSKYWYVDGSSVEKPVFGENQAVERNKFVLLKNQR